MECFGLNWIENVLISIVWLAVVVGVLYLLIPWVLGMFGISVGPLMQIVKLIVMGIVVVWVIVLVFELLGCMGGHVSLFPRH